MGNDAAEDGAASAAVKNFLLGLLSQTAEGFVGIDALTVLDLLEETLHGSSQVRRISGEEIAQALKRFANRLARVGEDQFRIEVPLKAHAATLRARSLPAVE